jgi:hypothetical protein
VNENFLHLEPPSDRSTDRYGDRLKLLLEPLPAVIPKGAVFHVAARLTLDGVGVPLVPFPTAPNGGFDYSDEKIPFGAAIGAAVVIHDVPGNLDQLRKIAMHHQGGGRFTGDDAEVTRVERTLAVRVVVKMRTKQQDQGAGTYRNSVRTAVARFRVGDQIGQNAPPDVWIVEFLHAEGPKDFRALVRRIDVDQNQTVEVRDLILPSIQRSLIHREGFRTVDPERGFVAASRANGTSPAQNIVFIERGGGQDVHAPPSNERIEAIGAPSSVFAWVATDHDLWNVLSGNATPVRRIANVQCRSLAVHSNGDVWAAVKTREQPNIHLARYDFEASGADDLVITRVSDMLDPGGRWMLLHTMADGGVLCYARYDTRRTLVRFDGSGKLVAVGSAPLNEVIEMGRNPYTGEAAVVHLDTTRQSVISIFNPALELERVIRPTDAFLQNHFRVFYSADISAISAGSRIWITGSRKEPDGNGNLIERGAAGYLDAGGVYHHVRGGMSVQTLVRAMM